MLAVRWNPKPYMLKAVQWLVSHGGAGLFLDPGLGKTSISLAAIKIVRASGTMPERQSFLVIAPLRPCYQVWPAEIAKWCEFNGLTYAILHGDGKEDALKRRVDIHIINPDGLPWLMSKIRIASFPFHGLIVDESTMFKHANTMRFKLLRPILHLFKRRWILTGTPAPNGLLDLFGQIYILDLGNALGKFITHYRRTFFDQTGFGGYVWVPQQGSEARIYERIEPLVLRMSEEDYLTLPKLIESPVYIDLPKKARGVYDQLEELFFTELEQGSVTAANAGVRSQKLRQVANGGIYLDKGDEDADSLRVRGNARRWQLIHEEKTNAVVELIEELSGKPALIAYDFHHDLERLRQHKALKKFPQMGGGNKPSEDKRLEDLWNADKLPGLFVNAQSVAHGLNLQQGKGHLIQHSLTWNFEHDDQLMKRLRRQGRKFPVKRYRIVARNTVDEALVLSLSRKNATQRGLLDALRAYSFRRPRR